MERFDRNNKTLILFLLVLTAIIVGGFFLIRYLKENKNVDHNTTSNAQRVSKIDKDKDYIYFNNVNEICEEWTLSFKDIVFNFEGNKELQDKLNDNMDKVRKSIKKVSENKDLVNVTDDETTNEDDIFSVDMIDYDVIESNNYISLIVSSYNYNYNEGVSDKEYNYYVFDLSNGKQIDNKEIIKKEKITDQKVRSKIRDYINGDEEVDIDVTLNNPYYLTIAKNGNVVINFVVKSNNLNYNVSIEMSD